MKDPFGLTLDQRLWSEISAEVIRTSPPWWTASYRDAVIAARFAEKVREARRP